MPAAVHASNEGRERAWGIPASSGQKSRCEGVVSKDQWDIRTVNKSYIYIILILAKTLPEKWSIRKSGHGRVATTCDNLNTRGNTISAKHQNITEHAVCLCHFGGFDLFWPKVEGLSSKRFQNKLDIHWHVKPPASPSIYWWTTVWIKNISESKVFHYLTTLEHVKQSIFGIDTACLD